MTGDPDLYPPDDEELTPEVKAARARAFWGVALVTFGTGLILDRILSADLEYFFLSIGFGLAAAWLTHRRYTWFVAAAIVTGIGFADLTGHLFPGAVGDAIACFCVAAAFAAIYVRYPHRSSWALVPAAIFAFLGTVFLGFGLVGAVAGTAPGVLMPGLLIAGGALLLNRNRVPATWTKVGLAALVAMFVLAAAAGDDHRGDGHRTRSTIVERDQALPAGLRELVIRTTSGDVDLSTAAGAGRLELSGRGRPRVVESGSTVTIDAGAADVDVAIPAGVEDVVIDTDSGDVEGTVPGRPSVEAHSERGDVEIDDTEQSSAEGANGTVTVRSTSGDIDVERAGDRDAA